MATRIHVTAARGCGVDEMRAVFTPILGEQFGCVAINEQNGWTWFTSSVWCVSANDLNRGLCQLARPAVQFTTSDGDRWFLTIHGGVGQQHFLHEFHFHSSPPSPEGDAYWAERLKEQSEAPSGDPALTFLEDEPVAGRNRPKGVIDLIADELAGMGAPIPEELRTSVAELPYSAAIRRYRDWHADRLSAALHAAGIAHDECALRAVLMWENVTENERGGDLGNLPRLLSVLGLGGNWDAWVQQAEAPPEPASDLVEQEPPPPPPDYIGPVLSCVDPLGTTPVAGGSVPLPLKKMSLVRFFPEACSTYAPVGTVITVSLPEDFDRSIVTLPTNNEANRQLELTGEGFRVGLQNHMWFISRDLRNLLGKPLTRLLYHLPDGAELDVAFADESQPATYQRYRGTIAGEKWHIDATHPSLTREALAVALELSDESAQPKHRVADAEEAEAILQASRRDPSLCDMNVERRGRTLRCKEDVVGDLAKLIFRKRFSAWWNVAPVEQHAEEEYVKQVEMQRQMRKAGAEAARRRAAPHDNEPLLESSNGKFWRSGIERLDELEQETRAKFDADLAALGFAHIGDVVAKKQRDIVVRTYGSGDRLTYGILMAKRTMYLGYEFFSRFADGTTLTTTTNAAVGSHPECGIYYKECPGLDAAALYAKHLWGIERFRDHRATEPVPLDPTLLSVAKELDAAFSRRKDVEPDE